ncbi:PDZ domain-containing protein [Deinococcus sp. 12RED42]|nr:PDZ domain-containing protein [Deinococcus sp. 12RED42]
MRCRMAHKGSPAEQAGLRGGDEIVAIDGADVRDTLFHELRLGAAPGVSSTYRVRRASRELDLTVTRVARPG